jgi:hypothetical protein
VHIVANLDKPRKLIVGNALAGSLAADRPTPLTDATRVRAEAVVAATDGLRLFVKHRPLTVDRATDAVINGCDRTLGAKEQSLRDTVVPLGDAQRDELSRVRRLRIHLFPEGTGFTQNSMDLEWAVLGEVRARAEEPQAAADIEALGMRTQMDHLFAHIDLYGRMLGLDADKARAGEEKASAAWAAAFQLFLAQVLVDYDADPVMRAELLGPYEAQLAQQRAAARAKRAAQGADEAEEPAPPAEEGGADPS